MASEYERPYRVQPGRMPVFHTQHQALDFLAEYQRRRAIRRCAHARVRLPTVTGGWDQGYVVHCEQASFEIYRGWFNGCPKGCRLYRSRWRAMLSRWRDHFHSGYWFERQPWQVK